MTRYKSCVAVEGLAIVETRAILWFIHAEQTRVRPGHQPRKDHRPEYVCRRVLLLRYIDKLQCKLLYSSRSLCKTEVSISLIKAMDIRVGRARHGALGSTPALG